MTIKNTANTGRGKTQPKESHSDITGNNFAALMPVITEQSGGCESNIVNFAEYIPVLIKSIGNKNIQSVSGRKLYVFLKVGRDFTTWVKARLKQYGFKEGVDYTIVEDLSSPVPGSAKSRQQIEHDYILSLDMAKELSMVERNDQGKAARRYFIDCEERLRRVAPEEHKAALLNWRKNRVTACEYHKSMAEAMKGYIERTGDGQKGFAYSNESRFLNKLVLGLDPVKWAKDNGVPSKQVRDSMNADQFGLLAYLESRDCALLDIDTPTTSRKAKLTELAQRWMGKRLAEVSDAE